MIPESTRAGSVAIPELHITPTAMQIFMFSAATWNRHHIHYSKDAAISEGLNDVVVQRALIGNFFARLLTNWTGDPASIRKISWKVLRSAVPNKKLACKGEVASVEQINGEKIAQCLLQIADGEGGIIATGDALVSII